MSTKELPSWHPLAARVQDMTLRDYFAAKAITAFIFAGNDYERAAWEAYKQADALLKAKEA